MEFHRVDPKSDIFVRYLFGSIGHEDMLRSFINAVNRNKNRQEISELQIANPFNVKTHASEKESIVDVKAKAKDGSFYDIEVQLLNKGSFAERSLYYWARIFASQLEDGNKYDLLKPVICINIINFKLPVQHPAFHSSFSLLELTSHERLSEHITLDFLGLPQLAEETKIDGELKEWLNFFRSSEGQKVMLDYQSPEVQKAVTAYKNFMADAELREAYEAHLKASLDYNSGLDFSYNNGFNAGVEQGREEGREEGRQAGRLDGMLAAAHNMLARSMSCTEISEITGLTIREIEALQK